MSTLIIVDGHNFLFKSFAVSFKFYSPKGTPLHVATTFLSLLRRCVSIPPISDIALTVIFDSQDKTSNNILSDSYKANRKRDYSKSEDSPFKHLPLIKAALDFLNIPWIEQSGVEADDVIASIAESYISRSDENQVLIASNDSDFFQLVSDTVKIIQLKGKGEYLLVDQLYVKQKLGISPENYVELKSWVGDKVDNIEGISGIGWKRGVEIILGKRKRPLSEQEIQRLELNKKLITLNRRLQISYTLSSPADLLRKSNQEIFKGIGI